MSSQRLLRQTSWKLFQSCGHTSNARFPEAIIHEFGRPVVRKSLHTESLPDRKSRFDDVHAVPTYSEWADSSRRPTPLRSCSHSSKSDMKAGWGRTIDLLF